MFNKIEEMLLSPLVQKLNSLGLNVDEATIKQAIANSPQIVQQIESILLASSSQEKLEKITALIKQSANGQPTAPTDNQGSQSK